MNKRFGYSKLDKPANFYRSGLSATDVRIALSGAGCVSLDQAVGLLADRIPPEAKLRCSVMKGGDDKRPLTIRVAAGCRDLVRRKLDKLVFDGKVQRNGSGKSKTYRWIENENDHAQQDQAGRGHAIQNGTG